MFSIYNIPVLETVPRFFSKLFTRHQSTHNEENNHNTIQSHALFSFQDDVHLFFLFNNICLFCPIVQKIKPV